MPLFAGGQAPALLNTRLAERTQALCDRAYAVLDSGITRGGLTWASYLGSTTASAASPQ